MKKADGATLEMIAKAAGVSPATVSNVLNRNRVGERSDAQRNAKRIRAIAGKLGYRPNMAARAMQTRRFKAIGLLASTDERLSVYRDYLPGLSAGCRQHGLHLGLSEVADERLSDEDFVPKILREWAVDGLIVAYMYAYPPELAELVRHYRIPAVWLNAKREHDCVYPQDFAGFAEGTRHLIEQGHRRICYVNTYESGHFSVAERRQGYETAMRDAGLQPHLMYPTVEQAVPLSQLLDDTRSLLKTAERPTAFITYTADQAMTVYHGAALSGLEVPREVSVIGSCHRPIDAMGRRLATLVLPAQEIGRRAVDLLTQKIENPTEDLPSVAIPYQMARMECGVAPPR